nr:hypothetical protein Iba_chr01cCG0960 [Ipomoea batatas]
MQFYLQSASVLIQWPLFSMNAAPPLPRQLSEESLCSHHPFLLPSQDSFAAAWVFDLELELRLLNIFFIKFLANCALLTGFLSLALRTTSSCRSSDNDASSFFTAI